MPAQAQAVFFWLTLAMTVLVLAVGVRMALRHRSAVPLLMVAGAFCAVAMEPVVAHLGHVFHPEPGQWTMFKALDRAVPWHIAFGYTAVFGIVYLLLVRRMLERTLSSSFLWRTMVVMVPVYILFEILPLSHGLWIYFGYQPLRPSSALAPLAWSFLNSASEIGSAVLMYVALTRLHGARLILLVPLAAVGATATHVGAGLPMYLALNSDWTGSVVQLAAGAAVLLSLVSVWLAGVVVDLIRTPAVDK
jgi:hypothetical protein